MKFSKYIMALGLAAGLSGCGTADRFAVSPPVVTDQISIGFASVEVRDVSLPNYAAADEIHTQKADGTLVSSSGVLWADGPERAIALEISENLSRLTNRRIASEPWPFEQFADARLEFRFSELLATQAGQFKASGQYFVATSAGRERSGLFDLAVPFDPKGGNVAIADARGQLIQDLSRFVARNGLK